MSQKKLLLPKSDSDSGSIYKKSSEKKHKLKSILIHNPRSNSKHPRNEVRLYKVAKENAISYEEFLDILQKPHVFIIKLNNGGCCRKEKYDAFEVTNLTGSILLKGKLTNDSVRIFDNRNRLFMILDYSSNRKGGDNEAVVSVPNSSIPLSTLRKLPTYLPYNKRFQMKFEHFPELNFNVEHQSIEGRYRRGSLFKYTITSGRKVVAKLLQPSSADQMYVLVDENVSVFQKSGILATSIFIVQRCNRNVRKWVCIGFFFAIVFLFGFFVVLSTVFNLRYKNPDFEGLKFPVKLKSVEK